MGEGRTGPPAEPAAVATTTTITSTDDGTTRAGGSPGPALPPVAAVAATRPPGRRLPHLVPLDGLRGIAIALVVGVHSGNALWPEARYWLAAGGPLGVDLFFVLSGFLITALLLGEAGRRGRIDLPAFAARRVRRLVPAVVGLVGVLVVLAVAGDRLVLRGVLAAATYALTFTTNLFQVHGDAPPVAALFGEATGRGDVSEVNHLWSVGIEAQFYLGWALVLWAVTRARWSYGRIALLTVALIVAVAAWRAYRTAEGEQLLWLYLAPSTRMDAPLVGSLVGVAWSAGWLDRVRPADALRVGSVALAAFVTCAWVVRVESRPLYSHGLYTVLALVAALALVGAVRAAPGSPLPRLLSWSPLVFLGTVSYSVYVWHYGIFAAVERHGAAWSGPARLAVAWAVSLAVAVASHRCLERPFLRRSRQRRDGGRPGEVSA
ncbi:MAG TPA: acyltransferase [Acidimicrobiales bacterium]